MLSRSFEYLSMCVKHMKTKNKKTFDANILSNITYQLYIPKDTVSVRSGVFRHNRDSVGTSGLYRHNKTSLLALATKMSSTELVPKNNQPKKGHFPCERK